ncbi:hypothetical protein [Lacimicrobium alkaliphilum]|uniref:Pyridine nucleotide transhydrogenase n=1 Tax=Lacimicrobium alkaliphilum TaxID=1526571 RepID=A0ABQ1RKA0_9ALTE|nr:hypothetical protein [Lacimicrobium alkaliphilum]GGD73009.1 hypothetical protein GCM10011357_30090 [Lacimicrobium alkaliphilum]
MQKLIVSAVLLGFSALAQAADESDKLTDCVAQDTLTINASCVENKINQNIGYRNMVNRIDQQAALQSGDNAVATIRFYPERYLIEVVTHRDALVAANRTH